MKIKITSIIVILLAVLIFTGNCSNPFKEENKKELVLEFINDRFDFPGRFILFWDGKDEKGNFVTPGRYIVLLEIKSWQDQEYVTVEEGGKDRANDQSRGEPGYWIDHDLQEPFPNPFRVQSGVNIPILLSSPSYVKISIYKD